MKKLINLKIFAIIFLAVMFGTAFVCLFFSKQEASVSANIVSINETYGYYYNQLSANSKKFYRALNEMKKSNAFKSGNGEYDLVATNVTTQSQLSSYANGSADLLKEFGLAKDAFNLDNPDIFYIDFDKLSLSVWSKADGTFEAKIDAGRTGSYYIDKGLSSASEIDESQTQLENKANSYLDSIKDFTTELDKIKQANEELISTIEYGFGEDTTGTTAHIRTIYGALSKGTAVCEGYARAFKYFMDKAEIPCTIIFGYLLDETRNTYEPHAWNQVRLDNGEWYAVDITLNDSNEDKTKYLLLGSEEFNIDHLADGAISNNVQKIKYPTLAIKDYGSMQSFEKTVSVANDRKSIDIYVSYNGKNAKQLLEEDNLYIVALYFEYNENGDLMETSYPVALYNFETKENKTHFYLYPQWQMTKFVVTSELPDGDEVYYTHGINYYYVVEETDFIENELFGTSKLPPVAVNFTPSNTAQLSALETVNIKVEYDEKLKKKDDAGNIVIEVETNKKENITKYVKIENIQFDGNKTLEFTFTPSLMYKHNNIAYNFKVNNLVSEKTLIAPKAFTYYFQRKSVICSKVLSGDRLYMDVYGNPTLIDNSDLNMQNWEINGKNVMEGQRSQLALVVSEPTKQAQNDMKDNVLEKDNLNSNDLLSYSTYELELDVCGFLTKIPEGSYVKLSFGFPDGFSAKDKGVTFKVYHFKYGENGKIDTSKTEELDCVVTEYGLVVTVNNFSPFMVVAVDSEKVQKSSTKLIYSRLLTNGGKISAKNGENAVQTEIATLNNESESVLYSITPNENYVIDYVLLNKQKIEVNEDNTIALNYAMLNANNTIEFAFVLNSIKEKENENNLTNAMMTFKTNFDVSKNNSTNEDTNTAKISYEALLIIRIVLSLIIAVIAILIIYNFYKKKSTNKK